MAEPTHYDVLALPRVLLDDAKADQVTILIKQSYHRALLRHHPDKAAQSQPLKPSSSSSSTSAQRSQPTTTCTIDQITTAYATLSSPSLRAQYDAHLRTTAGRIASSSSSSAAAAAAAAAADTSFQTGVETVDLDDLICDEDETGWSRPCRCGNERGFAFGEADLEEAGDLGELLVGCADCSLWLRVCFAVVENHDDVHDEEGRSGTGEGARKE